MARSVEEILSHADALADRLEGYEPDPSKELDPAAITQLVGAVRGRSDAERRLVEAVAAARRAGMSWASIGPILGTTGEAARQRYGRLVA